MRKISNNPQAVLAFRSAMLTFPRLAPKHPSRDTPETLLYYFSLQSVFHAICNSTRLLKLQKLIGLWQVSIGSRIEASRSMDER